MVALNDLYTIAERSHVIVYSFDMTEAQSLSCMTRKGKCFIAIDPLQLDTSRDEKVRLSHELGHCMTGSFYDKSNMLDVRGRHEYQANRWAIQEVIPWADLWTAFQQGITEVWELAEFFDVTEDFIHTALDIYRRQGKI